LITPVWCQRLFEKHGSDCIVILWGEISAWIHLFCCSTLKQEYRQQLSLFEDLLFPQARSTAAKNASIHRKIEPIGNLPIPRGPPMAGHTVL
jgi:hypothetical protein